MFSAANETNIIEAYTDVSSWPWFPLLSILTEETHFTFTEIIFCSANARLWSNIRPPNVHQLTLVTSEIKGANMNLNQIYCQLRMLELLKDPPWITQGVLTQVSTGVQCWMLRLRLDVIFKYNSIIIKESWKIDAPE